MDAVCSHADFTQTRTSGKASLFFYVMTDGIGRSVILRRLVGGDCERRFPGTEKAPIFLSVLCNY
jgi:hypothetical protein